MKKEKGGKKMEGLIINWKGQARRIVDIERETEKAVLAKIRNLRGFTDEEDKQRWEEYRKKKIGQLEEFIKITKWERRKKEAEEQTKALREGWEQKMWIPKSVIQGFMEE